MVCCTGFRKIVSPKGKPTCMSYLMQLNLWCWKVFMTSRSATDSVPCMANVLLAWPGEGCKGVCEVLSLMRDQQDTRTRGSCTVGEHQYNGAPWTRLHRLLVSKGLCQPFPGCTCCDRPFYQDGQCILCVQIKVAKVVAHQLWHNFFCVYGFPGRIHSDRGANFESALIAELLNVAGVQKSRTTPYHPMGNGAC